MHEKIGCVELNLDYYEGSDTYTDGVVEDQILEIVKAMPKEEYHRVIEECADWSILYHLSEIRENIVNWIDFDGSESVLEIGSGCGAITGVLARKCHDVTCVDLSHKRSLINAYRNKEKENIEILVGNFETIYDKLEKKYDVITLIGVFEYAQCYIAAEKPFHEFLDMIKALLKEDGKLIIAIENQYGLKYWAGCQEDHIREVFSGLEGYRNTNRVRTFSRTKLEQLLGETGFVHTQFFYPYPDYKFPTAVYSDDYLPNAGALNNNIRNMDGDRMYLFDESMVYDGLIDSNMFPFFSNSFLVIAER